MLSQEFLVDVVIKSTVLLVTAGLIDWMLYRASAAARHLLWATTFVALLFLPLVSGTAPPLRLAIVPLSWNSSGDQAESPSAQRSAIASTTTNSLDAPVDVTASAPSEISADEGTAQYGSDIPAASPPAFLDATDDARRVSASGVSFKAFRLSSYLLAVWSAGLVVALGPLLFGIASGVLRKRRSNRIADDESVSLLTQLCVMLGIRRQIELLETPLAIVPMTWGVMRPVVLVPSAWRNWPAESRRLVLLHELAHIKRIDVVHQTIARLTCSLFWFHPLAWYALRRLRIERELACDDCVLMSGALPSSYAKELLKVARECQAVVLPPAVTMAQPSGLEKRIRALFDKTRSHLPISHRRKRVVLLGVLATVTLLAAIRLDAVAEPPTLSTTGQAATGDHSDEPFLAAGAVARLGTVDLRNGRGVTAVAFSPDGEQLVSTGYMDAIRFWDIKTGRQLKRLHAGNAVYAIDFSPDGTKLASAGDGDVRLWDLEANEEIFASERHPRHISNITFAPDGLTFATAGVDEAVRLWDVATGDELVKLHTATAGRDSHPLVFSPDGRLLAFGDGNGEIRTWNLDTGAVTRFSREEKLRSLTSLAFTPDGQHMVSAGKRHEREEGRLVSRSSLSIWRVADGEMIDELASEGVSTLGSCSMVMTPDGESVVSSHREQIVVWDLVSREPRRIIDRPLNTRGIPTHGLAVSPDGLVATTGGSHKVYLWNTLTGEEFFPQPDAHHGAVLTIDTSPDQSLIVTGGEQGAIHLWDANAYEPIRRLTRTGNWMRSVQFFPDGQRVLAVGERSGPETNGFKGLALVLRMADGAVLRRLELPDRGMQAALSADGKYVAVAMGTIGIFGDGGAPQLGVWDLTSESEPTMFPSGQGEVKQVAFDAEAKHLYAVNDGGEIRRWEVATGELKETTQVETERRFGASAVLSLTGQFTMYGGLEVGSRKPGDRRGHLVMADMQTGKRVWSQETTDGWPKSLTVSQDGKHYAAWYSMGREKANPIIVGRVSDGKELARFDLSEDFVRSLAFSRDGTKLFSGMERGDVLVWEVPRF